jgi:hypothetical protein
MLILFKFAFAFFFSDVERLLKKKGIFIHKLKNALITHKKFYSMYVTISTKIGDLRKMIAVFLLLDITVYMSRIVHDQLNWILLKSKFEPHSSS